MILAIYPQKTSMLVSAMQAISRLDGHEAMPAHARLLLLVIADHVSSRGYAFPSQARLAGLCGMKEDAIGGRVRELAAHGWLELGRIDASEAAWWRAHGPDGHGPTTRATRYTLTLDKGRSWTEASPPTGGEYPGGHHHPRGGTIHTGTGGSAPSAPSALPPITPSGLGGMDDLDLLFPSAAPIGEPAASSSPEATKGAMVGTSVGEASPRSSLSPRNDNASQGMATTTPRSAARKNATEKNTQTRSGSGAEPRVSPRTGEDAMTTPKALSGHDKRAISVEALVDPRTLTRFLRGDAVRPMAKQRIEAAMQKLNLHAPTAPVLLPAPPPMRPRSRPSPANAQRDGETWEVPMDIRVLEFIAKKNPTRAQISKEFAVRIGQRSGLGTTIERLLSQGRITIARGCWRLGRKVDVYSVAATAP